MLRTLILALILLVALFVLIYITMFSWILQPTGSLPTSEVAVRQVKAEIFEKFFQIFITVTAIISGFAVTLAIAVFNLLKSEVTATVEQRVTDKLSASQTYSLLTTFAQLSTDEYWAYEPLFEPALNGQDIPDDTRSYVCKHAHRGHEKSSIGVEIFERLDDRQKEIFWTTPSNATSLLNLLNHRFYSRAVLFIVSKEPRTIGASELLVEEGFQLIALAEKYMRVASKEAISGCYDSVISCLYVAAKLTDDRNLRLRCVKLAHKFVSNRGLADSTEFAQVSDIKNVRKVLSDEVL